MAMRAASSPLLSPHPIDVMLATDELSLQFRSATRVKPPSADQISNHPNSVSVPADLQHSAATLLHAVHINPRDAHSYHALGEAMRLASAPPDVEAHYWGHAADLDPSDSTAAVRHANAAKAHAENLSNSSDAGKHVAAQKRALAAYRRVISYEQGARDPAAHANLGAILYRLGRHRECEQSFSKAATLLPTLRPSPPMPNGEATSSVPSPPLFTAEKIAAAAGEAGLLLQVLHGLDMCLLQQGKRKKAQRVQRIGLGLGLWRLPEQRPHTLHPGLLACGWHRKERYGELVTRLEDAAPRIHDEMLRLLRVRELATEGPEAHRWFIDTEHIAARPSLWLRRRLVCDWMVHASDTEAAGDNGAAGATPVTCSAVRAAAVWYAGSSGDELGRGVPRGFEGGIFSLLAAGSHIRPHTGPTNERVVLSLGLAGVDGAAIRIGDAPPRPWELDTAHVFDDSFEHEVRHVGGQVRAVLVLHFRHPMLMERGPVMLRGDEPCG